jgi:hypothetical protein
MMIQGLQRLSGMALGAALAATVLGHGVAAAAPLAPTPCQNASIVFSGGKAQPACVSQDGNTLVIVLNGTGPSTLVNGAGQTAPEPDMSAVTDPRIDSYAKRQAIRDQYRGRIDEVTFNDELGDGVSLDQALADAMQAPQKGHS